MCSTVQPACRRNATVPSSYGTWYDASAVRIAIGIPARFFSFRGGSAWIRYGSRFGSVGLISTVLSSDASETGGSYTIGLAVTPHRRLPNGGPLGSTGRRPTTRLGRALAATNANGPPIE